MGNDLVRCVANDDPYSGPAVIEELEDCAADAGICVDWKDPNGDLRASCIDADSCNQAEEFCVSNAIASCNGKDKPTEIVPCADPYGCYEAEQGPTCAWGLCEIEESLKCGGTGIVVCTEGIWQSHDTCLYGEACVFHPEMSEPACALSSRPEEL